VNFNWEDFLNVARSLTGTPRRTPSEESKRRCAVSRAYYSAFNVTRKSLANKGLVQSKRVGIQEEIIDLLTNSDNEDWRNIGMTLDRLKVERVKADYHDTFRGIDKKVNEVLKDAEGAIHKARTIFN